MPRWLQALIVCFIIFTIGKNVYNTHVSSELQYLFAVCIGIIISTLDDVIKGHYKE